LEEIQANQFAAELLMPRDLVLKVARTHKLEHAPDEDSAGEELDSLVAQMAEQFEVSRQAMTIRLSSLFA
jgi:Zn-dependent peptidase ImmA (M78 family)